MLVLNHEKILSFSEIYQKSENLQLQKWFKDMIKKLLTFLFYTCLFVINVNAIENKESLVIVFDFGGVIAKADTTQMANFLLSSFNINKEELSNVLRDMQNYVSSGGSEKQFWEQFAVSRKVVLSNDWFNEFGVIIKESITEITENVILVKKLQRQGYQTAMLSDVTQYQAEIIRKMGYYDLFCPVLLSYEIGVNKPNSEAFQILLRKLDKPASSVLFIDDRIENIEAAKNQGIDAIHFTDPKQLVEELKRRCFDLDNG